MVISTRCVAINLMVIVDSSVWIDFFNNRTSRETEILVHLVRREMLAVGDLILVEVLQGSRTDEGFERIRTRLMRLDLYAIGGYDIAVRSARNYRLLRRRGITIRKTIDVIIATFCIEHGHTLLHSDRDFDLMREPLGLVTL